jgi:hypothetical protein
MRVRLGPISFSKPSHFPVSEDSALVNPVALPPGRATLVTKPSPTGSRTRPGCCAWRSTMPLWPECFAQREYLAERQRAPLRKFAFWRCRRRPSDNRSADFSLGSNPSFAAAAQTRRGRFSLLSHRRKPATERRCGGLCYLVAQQLQQVLSRPRRATSRIHAVSLRSPNLVYQGARSSDSHRCAKIVRRRCV